MRKNVSLTAYITVG